MSKCDHAHEPWTGLSKEVEINLYVKPKNMPMEMVLGPNMMAVSNLAYAVAEVTCKKCGQQFARRSIIIRPEDIEIPLPRELQPAQSEEP